MKGHREGIEVGEAGTATLGVPLSHAGDFHAGVGIRPVADDSHDAERPSSVVAHRPFTRGLGATYIVQVLLNSLPLLLVDILALTAAVTACRLLFSYFRIAVGIDVSDGLLPIATGFVLLNFVLGLYPGVRLSPVEELRRLVISITCIFIFWAVGVVVLAGGLSIQRSFLLAVYLVCLVSLPICRGWARLLLARWTRWGFPVLVCGDDPAAVRLYHWLKDNRVLGLRPVGVIANPETLDVGPEDTWYAGSWADTHEIAVERRAFWAIVVPPENKPAALSSLIADHLYSIPHIHVVSELTGLPDHWNPQQLDGLPGLHMQQNLMLPLPRLMKRCIDLVAAVLGGILLLPLFFYIAVAVKLSSRGPILYAHERIGRHGRRFMAWKFRTMFQNAHLVLEHYLEEHPELLEEWQADHKLRYDPRVTRIGRFLRKTSLDELPQLWNVIQGEMSLVGPRPIVTAEIEKYGVYYGLYTMVKPGITGLWQVSGRNNTTYEERVQLDAYYVRNWSPWMDIYLLLRTIRIVLFTKGAY